MTLTHGAPAQDDGRARQTRALDEAALLEHAQDGDVDAFEQLVDAHLAEIFRIALMTLTNRSHAEDVTQDTFIGAWRNMRHFGTPDQLRTWLIRCCLSRCRHVRGRTGRGATR